MAAAVALGLTLLLGLGTWQLHRLAWKQDLIAKRAAKLEAPPVALPDHAADWSALDFRRIEARGVFRHDLAQVFGFTTRAGEPGHHLLTPLLRVDGGAVLVDRGWVPQDWRTPASEARGRTTVTGIARYRADDAPGWLTPDNEPDAGRWYWYDMAALEDALGLELLPVVIEADAGAGGAQRPPIGGQTRVELPNNHLQYAITWYALAAALLGVYVAYSLRPGRGPR